MCSSAPPHRSQCVPISRTPPCDDESGPDLRGATTAISPKRGECVYLKSDVGINCEINVDTKGRVCFVSPFPLSRRSHCQKPPVSREVAAGSTSGIDQIAANTS